MSTLSLDEANAKINSLAKDVTAAEAKVHELTKVLYEAKDKLSLAKDALNEYRIMVLSSLVTSSLKINKLI